MARCRQSQSLTEWTTAVTSSLPSDIISVIVTSADVIRMESGKALHRRNFVQTKEKVGARWAFMAQKDGHVKAIVENSETLSQNKRKELGLYLGVGICTCLSGARVCVPHPLLPVNIYIYTYIIHTYIHNQWLGRGLQCTKAMVDPKDRHSSNTLDATL